MNTDGLFPAPHRCRQSAYCRYAFFLRLELRKIASPLSYRFRPDTVLVQGVAEPGVSIGLAVVQDRIKPHYQKVSDEVYYIVRGQGQLTVGEATRELCEGDVAAIPKGQVHSFINTGTEPCLVLFSSGPKFEPETDRFFPEQS